MDRAFVFTNAAAHAQFGIQMGQLEELCLTFPQLDFSSLKPYRLRRCRTDLFADNTFNIHGPGETTPPVIKGSTYFNWFLIRRLPDLLFHTE
jgi:hypothetical protein